MWFILPWRWRLSSGSLETQCYKTDLKRWNDRPHFIQHIHKTHYLILTGIHSDLQPVAEYMKDITYEVKTTQYWQQI